jgi:hypothetical protein
MLVTEGFLGWLSRFKLIRLRRIIEYRILYRVEDSRRRCLGMGGWVGGGMEIRGVYRFSSLVKQKKKAKIYAVFCFAGKRFFFYMCAMSHTSPRWHRAPRMKRLVFHTNFIFFIRCAICFISFSLFYTNLNTFHTNFRYKHIRIHMKHMWWQEIDACCTKQIFLYYASLVSYH